MGRRFRDGLFVHRGGGEALLRLRARHTGSQTQTTPTVQQISQMGVQLTLDPQTWVETAKNGARSSGGAKVIYDDSTSINYTTATGTIFQLQILYSLTG
jgi:hypothetical protein